MKRIKVADHVDATGRLVGCRMLSNMTVVEWLEQNFDEHAKHKSE